MNIYKALKRKPVCFSHSGDSLSDTKTESRVTILLSVFNGESYLPPLLSSLASQQGVEWQLLWHDDASDDNTMSIMKEFSAHYPAEKIRQGQYSGKKLGIARAYLSLLKEVPRGHLVAFADQDDVWLASKLYRAVQSINTVPHKQPVLYCSRQILVNESLNFLGISPKIEHVFPFPFALTHNIATGCTVVLNQQAVCLLSTMPDPPAHTLHDWWAYICVNAVGGKIRADEGSEILYRQHAKNVVGAVPSFFTRAVNAFHRGPRLYIGLLQNNVETLLSAAELLPKDTMKTLYRLQKLLKHGGVFTCLWFLVGHFRYFRRQTYSETAVLYLWMILHSLRIFRINS